MATDTANTFPRIPFADIKPGDTIVTRRHSSPEAICHEVDSIRHENGLTFYRFTDDAPGRFEWTADSHYTVEVKPAD